MKTMCVAAVAALVVVAPLSAQDAGAFARRVYEVTRTRQFAEYQQLTDPRCQATAASHPAFDMRGDILNRMSSAAVEAMPIGAYRAMMQRRGAAPPVAVYRVEPSHVVVVHGTIPGLAGADYVALNPIADVNGTWTMLDGDCLAAPAPAPAR
jgi:hypothetical protein